MFNEWKCLFLINNFFSHLCPHFWPSTFSHWHLYFFQPNFFSVSTSPCLLFDSSLPSPLNDFSMQVIIYQGGQVFSLANHLNGRVGFVATMPSTSASIFINNTQLTDTGTYQCLVNNLPDRGGRNIGVIGLTVLGNSISTVCVRKGNIKDANLNLVHAAWEMFWWIVPLKQLY